MRSLFGLALAAGLGLGAAACGDGDDDDDGAVDAGGDPSVDGAPTDAAIPRDVVTATVPLVPGELVEGIFEGGPDDFAIIELAGSTETLDWNIHGHEDGGTQTVYEEFDRMTVTYRFTPTSDTRWWLLLRNGGGVAMDVDVRIELHADMQWEWQ